MLFLPIPSSTPPACPGQEGMNSQSDSWHTLYRSYHCTDLTGLTHNHSVSHQERGSSLCQTWHSKTQVLTTVSHAGLWEEEEQMEVRR